MNTNIRIIFFGTSAFGALILEKLVQAGLKPVLVVTTPDKPTGRKQQLTPPPVKILAEKYNLPIVQPKSISNSQFLLSRIRLPVGSISNQIPNLNDQNTKPDLFIFAAYGKIVPRQILDIPKHGALNVHPSLLPKFRGPSPVQSAILAGEKETGVTIMLMDEEVDHGPILASTKFEIGNSKPTYEELHNNLAELGGDLLVQVIPGWVNGEIVPKEQDHSSAMYTKKIEKEDGRIDWNQPAVYRERQIRAFSPWPGAFTFWKGKRIKILKAHVEGEKLIIDELQTEGKKPTTFREFLLGHKDFVLVNKPRE